jgi:hypothetical protein
MVDMRKAEAEEQKACEKENRSSLDPRDLTGRMGRKRPVQSA